jgi:hypothetical protein
MADQQCIKVLTEGREGEAQLLVQRELDEIGQVLLTMKQLAHRLVASGVLGQEAVALETLAEKAGAITDGVLDMLGAGQVCGTWNDWRTMRVEP